MASLVSQDWDRRWLKRFGRSDAPADIRLLCFHHAGGSAATFRRWPQLLPPTVETVAVQLPGRADRFNEPAFERMSPLIDELVEVLSPLLDRPFAVYGVSMGSRVAWTLTHELRTRSLPMPIQVFLACDTAPTAREESLPWEDCSDGLAGYLREMGGTPPEVLEEPELLHALLPTLEADLNLLSAHRWHPQEPLDVRIRAFAGTDDASAPPDELTGWEQETTARFDLDVLRSGHFFDAQAEQQVIEAIRRDLARDGQI